MNKIVRQFDRRNEAYHRLPSLVQFLVTLISGAPPTGQKPTWLWNRPLIFTTIIGWWFTGFCLSSSSLSIFDTNPVLGLWSLTAGWILTTGAFRATMTTIQHDIVHSPEKKCGKRKDEVYWHLTGWVGETLTAILWLPDVRAYYDEHVLHHHVQQYLLYVERSRCGIPAPAGNSSRHVKTEPVASILAATSQSV